jgi:phosphoribosylglycinamide formyltransferase-1
LADRAPVAVFISGSGTNMAALLYASRAENCPYRIVLVLSNNPDASGLKLAEAEGVATFCLPHKGIARADHDAAMEAEVVRAGARFIALAGYMRILSPHSSAAGKAGCSTSTLAAAEIQGPARTIARSRRATATAAARSISSPPNSTTARSWARRRWRSCRAIPATPGRARADRGTPALFARAGRLRDARNRAGLPVAQVRERAMALPEADEVTSHGMPCFGVTKGKKFAYVSIDHHGDGRTALLVKISGLDEQEQLIESDPARYYRPAYFGDGWIAIRLDLGDTDWDGIADWLRRSWAAIAPKRLAAMMDF